MAERASVFDGIADLDLSDFAPQKPKPAAPPEQVRQVAEKSAFRSREPEPAAPAKRAGRVHRTGRNIHINLKIRAETRELFYKISDAQNWVLGETFEHALQALQRELDAKGQK